MRGEIAMSWTIEIEDGTIPNHKQTGHRREKAWVAVVERDKSKPGGLRRDFLPRAPGGRVFVVGVEPGCWLEFAADYYTCSGSKRPDREYVRVVGACSAALHVEDCSLEEIGKLSGVEPTNPLAAYTTEQLRAELERRVAEADPGSPAPGVPVYR
jgi:hypothetical protein